MTYQLAVDVTSSITPEDLRSRLESELPDFSFRSGNSGQQGGTYISATSVGVSTLTLKVWFYDDRPQQFSLHLSELVDGASSTAPDTDGVVVSVRRLLEGLGTVVDRP